MDTILIILAIIAGIIGIAGSVIPGLPGPPIGWLGMLLMSLRGATQKSTLLIMLIVTTAVTLLDYFIPGYFTKKTGGSKAGSRGAIVGLFLGMFFLPPWGIIAGTMLGAFAAEIIFAEKGTGDALKSALGAFMGFVFGTGIKLVTSCVMMYYIIAWAFAG
ncbi:MAG: DUF456 domain-containing protein [Bacteroidales bacterium]|nr:DUF456 domain-containing protein [Bacteroidales bacterium]